MSGQKWTPGPWNTRNHGVIVGGPFHQFYASDVVTVCKTEGLEFAEFEKDLALIAAALAKAGA